MEMISFINHDSRAREYSEVVIIYPDLDRLLISSSIDRLSGWWF